jgi:hypothetical protein
MEKHRVSLTDKERRKLVAIVTKGRNKASSIQRAHILLKSADGKTDAEISQWLYISEATVRRTRLRFCDGGIDAALADEAPAGYSKCKPLIIPDMLSRPGECEAADSGKKSRQRGEKGRFSPANPRSPGDFFVRF